MDGVKPRSIIWDEIGHRLGRGRKFGRKDVSTPANVSHETKRLAVEHAKGVIVNRHWDEVLEVFAHEIEFFQLLDEWYLKDHPKGVNVRAFDEFGLVTKPTEAGTVVLAEVLQAYYEAHQLSRANGVQLAETTASIVQAGEVVDEGAIIDAEGRELFHGRPRPRKKSEVS